MAGARKTRSGNEMTLREPTNARDLAEEIVDIVAAEAMMDRDRLGPDVLLKDLDIQSADYVMILMSVEEKYGVYISVDSAFTDAKTVGELVKVVADRIRDAPAGAAA
jgi:acyl carrier protein